MRVSQPLSTDARLVEVLNELMAFDLDVMAAYEAAIARLDDLDLRRQLANLQQGHRRQVDELTACVTMLGGQPRSMGDAKIFSTQAKVVLANLRGERTILQALGSNERSAARRYDLALHEWATRAPARVGEVLMRGLHSAREHHSWLLNRARRH